MIGKRIAILAATFDGNKGAAAMLKSIVKNLDAENTNYFFNILTVYPKNDRQQNPFKNVKIISCKAQEIIFIGFPLAILFYLFKWLKPIKKILLKYKILKGFYQADLVVDAGGITFVDSRGFIMNAYNFVCMAVPLLLGKRIVKYSQALGPFNNFFNRILAKMVLPKIYKICARGEITKKHLDGLKLSNTLICADGAFSLPDDPDAEKKIRELIKGDDF
ncbi:MAG TPA: polysaccharide pyruvyl transferase family protein, partial [Candidatus Humimicrobiaceae bacterium]